MPAGAAKLLSPSTPFSTLLRKKKPKLCAQAAASHNKTRRVKRDERERARSIDSTEESQEKVSSHDHSIVTLKISLILAAVL